MGVPPVRPPKAPAAERLDHPVAPASRPCATPKTPAAERLDHPLPLPTLIEITSADDPRIADYRAVREAELREHRSDAPGGLFVAEGELVVRRLIASPFITRSVLVTPTRLGTIRDALDRLPHETPVYIADQPTMNSIIGFNIHRGILAIGLRGHPPPLESLLLPHRTLVVLEDLTNHDNIGGIFRNTAALAGTGARAAILLSPRCADPLYRKSIRVSVGQALSVPFATLENWPGDLATLRGAGYFVLALTPSPRARDISEVQQELRERPRPIALLLGAEGPGLTGAALDLAEAHVRIPMPGRDLCSGAGADAPESAVDSLNVSVAAAVALHPLGWRGSETVIGLSDPDDNTAYRAKTGHYEVWRGVLRLFFTTRIDCEPNTVYTEATRSFDVSKNEAMRYKATKLTQAAAVLLREHGHTMSYMRLVKLLYIANRESLREVGAPIIDDRNVAMKHGPVLSNALDVIRGQSFHSPEWDRFISRQTYEINLTADPGIGKLSRFEINKLQRVAAEHAHLGDWELVELTHTFPEWIQNAPPEGSSKPIPLEHILSAVGRAQWTESIKAQLALSRETAGHECDLGLDRQMGTQECDRGSNIGT